MNSVQVYEKKLIIPTYEIGSEDQNPPFQRTGNGSIYPYAMQDDLDGERVDKAYNAVYLENRYLRVIVLPEIGGKLYSAQDKTTGNEMFYRNNVVKPGLIALRGAWISGGIEFNFPHGHTISTFMPIDYVIRESEDGSASVTVSNLERIFRMKWAVSITLYPDTSHIETAVFLYNRTPLPHRYYFWANSAVPATERMQFIYPMTKATTGNRVVNFPIHESVDLSWYVNHPRAVDLFALDTREDFFGCYEHDADAGVIHVSNSEEAWGKKFFTWGTTGDGSIWTERLTDNDGPYCEIQSGKFATQSIHGILPPHAVDTWKEYWLPVKKMGNFVWANKDAALNLEFVPEDEPQNIKFAFNTTSEISGEVLLKVGEKTIYKQTANISPEEPFSETVPAPADMSDKTSVTLTLLSETEEEIISYTKGQPIKEAQPASEKEMSEAEKLCKAGLEAEKRIDIAEAKRLYEEALQKEPNFAPARRAIGILYLKSGEFDMAEEQLKSALNISPDDQESHYYLGLVFKAQGKLNEAKAEFSKNSECANYFLGEIAMIEGDFANAARLFEKSIVGNPLDVKAIDMRAIALRKLGKVGEARNLLKSAFSICPTDFLALTEYCFIAGAGEEWQDLMKVLRNEAQSYLEVATDYENAGLYDESIAVLSKYVQQNCDKNVYPLVYYHLGYYFEKVGNQSEARKNYQKGKEGGRKYVLPHRLETIQVLRNALKIDPSDARARYYLGNLLYSKGRYEEAIEEWEKSTAIEPDFPIVHRNLGLAYRKLRDDIPSAIAEYECAVACDKGDYRLYLDLNELYLSSANILFAKRLAMFRNAPESVKVRSEIASKMASLYVESENYDEAITLLNEHKFNPWEGARAMHKLYSDAHIGRGKIHYDNGEYQQALKDFLAALEYPPNLGVGKPPYLENAPARYLAALAYKALGEIDKAKEMFQQVIEIDPNHEGARSELTL